MNATTEILLETMFSTRSVQRGYKEDNWSNRVSSIWESVKIRSSWKRDAIQRVFEPGSKEIDIVRSPYQATPSEDTTGWKRLSRCCVDL
jgi:hypothetical protein